ncbi:hypothetical protein ACFRAE_17345 [Sphingobacterium sp. HJSM2_6]|uniref:hypothetical protein n=1 Tax=Sphingobacterium sp. HJSM2_6 TaxID=3366264 RepID=UPI003BD44C85
MIYTKMELLDTDIRKIALRRYLHKFKNHRNEIKKLKLFELEFLFSSMKAIVQISDSVTIEELDYYKTKSDNEKYEHFSRMGLLIPAFDLYSIEEASEFVFYRIGMNYFFNYLFIPPVLGPHGYLSSEQIDKDKLYFDLYYPKWENILISKKGPYMAHLNPEFNRKVKILLKLKKSGLFGNNHFKVKYREIVLACFHIYFKVKLFFDGMAKLEHCFEIKNIKFVFDVYSYIHILSRHYMPSINSFDIERTYNEELPFIDIDFMPLSIESILKRFSKFKKIQITDEFIMFRFKNSPYILWFKSLFNQRLSIQTLQIRTLYRIENKNDLAKMDACDEVQEAEDLVFFI